MNDEARNWQRLLPFLLWWPRVNRQSLRADLFAGLTNAVVVLPQGVAFAMIAGLPPEYGLYTAIITPIIAAMFGSSRHLISGPTTPISLVVFATVSGFAEPGTEDYIRITLTLTFLAGVYQLAFGLARLGRLVNFVSHSVIVGFTAGAAILIATSQIRHVLGIELPRGEDFIYTWLSILHSLEETDLRTLSIAAATLGAALLIKRLRPGWPNLLLAMIIGGALSWALGAAAAGVAHVGALPAQLPPLSAPDLSLQTLRELASSALAVALLALIEAVSIGRAIATQSGQRIDGNQEFLGQGLSNLIGSFFSAYAGSGSFTRSGINYAAGARTPLSAVFAALALALIVLFIAPLTAHLPIPAMGGVILLVAWNLINPREIRHILSASRAEMSVLLVTFFSTLLLELEFAIYAGVMLSLVLYLNRTARPKVISVAPDPKLPGRKIVNIENDQIDECPQLKMARIDGSLFFGAVDHVSGTLQRMLERNPEQRHLLLVCPGINFIDLAGEKMLSDEARGHQVHGGTLSLVGLKRDVREGLLKSHVADEIGIENVHFSKKDALGHIVRQLDPEICRGCRKRIFVECRNMPGVDELGREGAAD